MKFSDLVLNSEALLPGVYNRAVMSYEVRNFKVTEMLGMKTRIVSALVKSDRPGLYKVVLQLNRVDLGCSEDNDVVVRCNCPCYRFWFNEANSRVHIMYGKKLPAYVPVPEEQLQRPRPWPHNPAYVPGMCKHIILLAKHLKRKGLMC
jgi:hypothetical protein